MTLPKKCAIFLVVLCTMSEKLCSGSDRMSNSLSEESDEDKKLKQALVLVDLLKQEYVRALRENYELRKKETQTTIIEDSTCASTDQPTSNIVVLTSLHVASQSPALPLPSSLSKQLDPTTMKGQGPWRRRLADVTPNPSRQISGKNRNKKPYFSFRRNNKENKSLTEAAPTLPDTTKSSDTTIGSDYSTILTDTPDTADTIDTTFTDEPAAELPTTSINTILEQLQARTTTTTTASEDPLESEVASELISELKAAVPVSVKVKMPSHTPESAGVNKYFTLIKPTLKIHLGGSTRLPVPLPENHAFCYTNPRSSLCRTAI